MRIDIYISELLYRNDCVIIPGLGGFVANTRSAFLNPAQHTFHPPAKKIAFNAGLRTNDGLLANHISKALNISYQEASNAIMQFVEDSFRKLQTGEVLQLNAVGTLQMDHEKHLQFEPDTSVNYLTDSFGLTTIHSPAIRRDEPAKVKTLRGAKQVKPAKVRNGKIWKLWELVPAAAVLTFLAFSPSTIKHINSGLASIFPAETTITVPAYHHKTYKTVAIYPPLVKKEVAVSAEESKAEKSAETKVTPETISANEVVITKQEEAHEIAAPESTKVASAVKQEVAAGNKQYFVIGGCFLVEENAVKFRDEAIAQGYKASIIGKNDKGMSMVSLYEAADKNDARSQSELIKEKFQKGAWVFSK